MKNEDKLQETAKGVVDGFMKSLEEKGTFISRDGDAAWYEFAAKEGSKAAFEMLEKKNIVSLCNDTMLNVCLAIPRHLFPGYKGGSVSASKKKLEKTNCSFRILKFRLKYELKRDKSDILNFENLQLRNENKCELVFALESEANRMGETLSVRYGYKCESKQQGPDFSLVVTLCTKPDETKLVPASESVTVADSDKLCYKKS